MHYLISRKVQIKSWKEKAKQKESQKKCKNKEEGEEAGIFYLKKGDRK